MKKLIVLYSVLFLSAAAALHAYMIDIDYSGFQFEKKDTDSEIYKSKDGSVIRKYADREEAVFSNGTRIIRKKDRSREITAPDGTLITIAPDGTAVYKFTNGKTRTVSMDGYTHYGLKIKDVKKIIYREDFKADIIYSGLLSDDLCDKNILRFFNEFIFQMQAELNKNKSIPAAAVKIEISNCRFCLTGYCARTGKKQVEIIVSGNGRILKRISLSQEDISHPRKFASAAKLASEQIFSSL